MKTGNFEEILMYIDIKIDECQTQYVNGVKDVALYIKDLQEIRSLLVNYRQRYL
jgi:hypothetical protein